jgi:hypothetical protein
VKHRDRAAVVPLEDLEADLFGPSGRLSAVGALVVAHVVLAAPSARKAQVGEPPIEADVACLVAHLHVVRLVVREAIAGRQARRRPLHAHGRRRRAELDPKLPGAVARRRIRRDQPAGLVHATARSGYSIALRIVEDDDVLVLRLVLRDGVTLTGSARTLPCWPGRERALVGWVWPGLSEPRRWRGRRDGRLRGRGAHRCGGWCDGDLEHIARVEHVG